jgi:hypothetical protein
MTSSPRMVRAATFKVWWMRLEGMAETDGSPRGARYLLEHLYAFGRRAGATRLFGEEQDAADPLIPTMRWHLVMEPAFDWVAGEIDFSSLSPYAPIDPELIIADIVRRTGLPEHTSLQKHTSQDSLPVI